MESGRRVPECVNRARPPAMESCFACSNRPSANLAAGRVPQPLSVQVSSATHRAGSTGRPARAGLHAACHSPHGSARLRRVCPRAHVYGDGLTMSPESLLSGWSDKTRCQYQAIPPAPGSERVGIARLHHGSTKKWTAAVADAQRTLALPDAIHLPDPSETSSWLQRDSLRSAGADIDAGGIRGDFAGKSRDHLARSATVTGTLAARTAGSSPPIRPIQRAQPSPSKDKGQVTARWN